MKSNNTTSDADTEPSDNNGSDGLLRAAAVRAARRIRELHGFPAEPQDPSLLAEEADIIVREVSTDERRLREIYGNLVFIAQRFQGIRKPNSGPWTKKETERSYADLEKLIGAVLSKHRDLVGQTATDTPPDSISALPQR